jgi:transcriptional regulator with XRE-family HTH domain
MVRIAGQRGCGRDEVNTHVSFADRVRQARTEAGLKQAELAKRMRVHQSEVSAYERGRYMPTFWNLCELARALNVSLDWLCGLSEKRELVCESN